MQPVLHVVGYDVATARRLRHALASVTQHAWGGQRSVFECWFRPGEALGLRQGLSAVLDPRHDRWATLRIGTGRGCHILGRAIRPDPPGPVLIGWEGAR